jgi:hypothetical protein
MTGAGPAGPEDTAGPAEPDAVEQLQRAVLTAIGAARVALDALEAVVADRSRLDHLAAGGRDLVGSLWGTLFGRPDDDADDDAAADDAADDAADATDDETGGRTARKA